jgi:SAM-dependent methyltransferase
LTHEIEVAAGCPLCSADGDLCAEFDVHQLIQQWQAHCGIDIASELAGVCSIAEYRCQRCSLRYYSPAAAGSEHLYQQLQGFPWYYTEKRWEHLAALRDIPHHAAVLDVGCGFGAFLDLVGQERQALAKGVDLSASAVEVGQALGRRVIVEDVCHLADEEANYYDAVCTFQVLEHVPNPRQFLEACVRLLKPGGRLCISVPNDDGYLGKQRPEKASLNLPPHHLSRWGKRTLMSLEALFPLKVRRIAFEPLSELHVPEYVTAWLDSLDGSVPQGFLRTGAGLLSARLLAGFGLRRLVRGHSTYASYTRLPSVP